MGELLYLLLRIMDHIPFVIKPIRHSVLVFPGKPLYQSGYGSGECNRNQQI
jgi:hypothetical protein